MTTELAPRVTFRVWVGCLACYNNGHLVGFWVNAEEAAEAGTQKGFNQRISTPVMHEIEQHEEFWVFDVEAPHSMLVKEMSPVEATEIAKALALIIDEGYVYPFLAWVDDGYATLPSNVDDAEELLDQFESAFIGHYDSRVNFAMEFAMEGAQLPDELPWPYTYIDWEKAADELFHDYIDIDAPDGGIYVFSPQ